MTYSCETAAVSHYSAFLFANPSFVHGTAHLLDFWGTYDSYNYCRTREEADMVALYADWRSVGEELFHALNQAAAEQRESAF